MRTIVHTIAHVIVHTIMRISMLTKACTECTNKFHMEHVRWMMDNGQTHQKNGQQIDCFKNDASAKKDMLLA